MKKSSPSFFNLRAAALLLFSTICLSTLAAFTQDRPNILWIVSEDNSPFLGCYGDEFATTPRLDQLAEEGIRYENAFATAPVCAPSRSCLITGMYPPSLGTQQMRSDNAVPDFVRFYPHYLRAAGYYCTNNAKKDYNTVDQPEVWDESSRQAHYKNRKAGQPFFAIFNIGASHESSIHKSLTQLKHDPKKVPIPPYHPRTPEMEHDWAQYYDKVQLMDSLAGALIDELAAEGLAENTLVFYYSDHGGILGRSKRFMFESGLHIPLIIRFPEKYQHLAPDQAGSSTDRIVTFLDFAPTLLSLAGVKIPDYMQGHAFLGSQEATPREYGHSFRGRMDEVYDMARSIRDKQYRYSRNYMPHRIYGQHLAYLWRAPSMQSWEKAFLAGECNDIQSAFFRPKPAEELYDCLKDPHNIHNLAQDPAYKTVLERMRKAQDEWLIESSDAGFLAEGEMIMRGATSSIYEYAQSEQYAKEAIVAAANLASLGNPENLSQLMSLMKDPESGVRYWAATGCAILGSKAEAAKKSLKKLSRDTSPNVRIAAAEALWQVGETKKALATLSQTLVHEEEKVRLHALNVLRLMEDEALPLMDEIKALEKFGDPKSRAFNRRYDLRVVRYLRGR